ncbi:MAG TPA: amidohydrolase family protein [Dehalococcoidia bacterium]|jgi:predicted TIM-barrel fold metal-dependent hydrolase
MKAIDVHAHPSTAAFDRKLLWGPEVVEYISKYYGVEYKVKTDEEMAQDFRELDVKAILIGWDAESASGLDTSNTNDEVARLIKKFPDVFIGGWAMIDPWKGNAAIKELERCVKDLGLMGLKFQQALQAFFPNDRRFYPLYEKCVELKIPVSFHTGTTGAGAGMPGGHGIRLKYTMPVPYIDDVAADFPELTIVMIHPAWPWHEEQIAVLLHKGNVYADLSGWAPKYFPDVIKKEVNSRLQDKFMYGSDYPEIPPKRWLQEFESGGYKPEVMEKVLYKNAQRILKLKV